MQSSWHNLPDFGGSQQKDGEEYCSSDVKVSFGESKSCIEMQLKNAWPPDSGLTSYIRRVLLKKGQGVRVEGSCAGNFKQAALSLMLCMKPIVESDALILPELCRIRVDGAKTIRLEPVPVTDSRLRCAWPDTLYRVRIEFKKSLILDIF